MMNNIDCVEEGDRFKFVDGLSILEIVNILTTVITAFNIKQKIPYDNQFITSNIEIQNIRIPNVRKIFCFYMFALVNNSLSDRCKSPIRPDWKSYTKFKVRPTLVKNSTIILIDLWSPAKTQSSAHIRQCIGWLPT